MKIELKPYQAAFQDSTDSFAMMVAAIGTGKTFMMLLKIWNYCEEYPDTLALIVRKEFTDLRDSTIKDFETYFGVTVGSDKDFRFKNGSIIMFRHGAEMAVLKNMNLSIVGIEQAEEFDTDDVFVFLNDRLRRKNAPYRQLCLIANANGHNWVHRWGVQGATIEVMDEKTGQILRRKKQTLALPDGTTVDVTMLCVEANTFANSDNLVPDFLGRLMSMKNDAPGHYLQYVMNSHEEVDADDLLFKHKDIYDSPSIVLPYQNRIIKRVGAIDVARFGKDETVFTIIEQKDIYRWEQTFLECYTGKDTVWTSGYAMELERRFDLDLQVVDDVGVGGGVTDNLRSNGNRILPFIANASVTASKEMDYFDNNDEGFLMMADLLSKGWLKTLNDVVQQEQAMSIRFTYKKKGPRLIKHILSKEEMRIKHKETDSPDRIKALMMAVWGTDKRPQMLQEQRINLPKYGNTDYDVQEPAENLRQYEGRFVELPTHGSMA